MTFSRDQLIKMRGSSPYLALPLIPTIERDGEKFPYMVIRVEVTNDLEFKPTDERLLCRNEGEARENAKRLCEERNRAEAEKPTPCDVLEVAELIRGQEATVRVLPISQLPKFAGKAEAVENKEPDHDFLDIGHVHWEQPGVGVEAGLGTILEHDHFIEAYRLCKYHEPYPMHGALWPFGVECVEMKEDGTVKEVRFGKRWVRNTEEEARAVFEKLKAGIPRERDALLNGPKKSKEEKREDGQLEQIQKLIAAARDRQTRAAHERHRQKILDVRRAREQAQAEASQRTEQQEKERTAAQEKLFEELFPNLHAVKARLKDCRLEDVPDWKDQMRRALKIDCRRLKISSPFNQFIVTDDLVQQLNAARKAKSPARAEDIEVVLNWAAKRYAEMPQAKIARLVSSHSVNPASFGKRLTRKFGLKSNLKGRPQN